MLHALRKFWEKGHKIEASAARADDIERTQALSADRIAWRATEASGVGEYLKAEALYKAAREREERRVESYREALQITLRRPLAPSRKQVAQAIDRIGECAVAVAQLDRSANADDVELRAVTERGLQAAKFFLLALVYEQDLTEDEFSTRLQAILEGEQQC